MPYQRPHQEPPNFAFLQGVHFEALTPQEVSLHLPLQQMGILLTAARLIEQLSQRNALLFVLCVPEQSPRNQESQEPENLRAVIY